MYLPGANGDNESRPLVHLPVGSDAQLSSPDALSYKQHGKQPRRYSDYHPKASGKKQTKTGRIRLPGNRSCIKYIE